MEVGEGDTRVVELRDSSSRTQLGSFCFKALFVSAFSCYYTDFNSDVFCFHLLQAALLWLCVHDRGRYQYSLLSCVALLHIPIVGIHLLRSTPSFLLISFLSDDYEPSIPRTHVLLAADLITFALQWIYFALRAKPQLAQRLPV